MSACLPSFPRRSIRHNIVGLAFGAFVGLAGSLADADRFELKSGGQVTGKLVDRGKEGQYVIEVEPNSLLTLTKQQVERVVAEDAQDIEYDQRSRRMPNRVEAHQAMVRWCKENRRSELAKHHQRLILELDPNNEEARLDLGYQRHQGRWLTRDEIMAARGLVYYDGAYRTSQDIALRQRAADRKRLEAEWIRKLRTWRGWLDGRRASEAADLIASIDDSLATTAILKELQRERNERIRDLLIATLAKLKHPKATQTLVDLSLDDPSRDVRLQCLDYLLDLNHSISLAPYIKTLRHPDNELVNRAAEALRILGNPEAISPLIDALITTHKERDGQRPPGEITTSFSPSGGGGLGAGGGGFSVGGGKKERTRQYQNYEVSRALVELSGGQNFLFDERAWRRWYVNEQIEAHVDTRRDK